MDSNEVKSVPTASGGMLQPSTMASRNELTNGALSKFHKKDRVRSKSESHHPSQDTPKDLVGIVVKSAKDKSHDRKPKNLKGSGKAKKGRRPTAGGGGKGTWGKNGAVYEEESEDPKDPNYDSETDKNKINDVIMQEVIPDLSSSEFDGIVTPLILEYYDHGITDEVVASLQELNITHLKHRIVFLVIALAMEKKGAQRELTSVLLADLYGERVVYEQDFELGFQALMNSLPELKLDTPDAAQVLGQFMARCVADDCLNPCYIREHLEHPTEISKQALELANKYLSMKHGLVRLDDVWGFGGGIRPVKTLIKKIVLLIKEYISSHDLREAERCVVDLDVPHFHHEIVYEAIVIALEDGTEDSIRSITDLLKRFSDATIISIDQMSTGFQRIYDNIDDLVLDIPRAHKHLDNLLEKCCRAGVVSLALRQKAPSRGRKRYVSEGDFAMSSIPLSH